MAIPFGDWLEGPRPEQKYSVVPIGNRIRDPATLARAVQLLQRLSDVYFSRLHYLCFFNPAFCTAVNALGASHLPRPVELPRVGRYVYDYDAPGRTDSTSTTTRTRRSLASARPSTSR